MADIFLSYSREDQATARRFSEALTRAGFTVWWDQALKAGETFDQVTEQALKQARAVIVLWSRNSVQSRWVRSEATLADRYGTLVPVMIEPCDRPIMFELMHTADLSGWNGNDADARWRGIIDGLQRVTSRAAGASMAAATPAVAARTRSFPARGALLAAGVVLVAGAGMFWSYWHGRATPQAGAAPAAVQPLAGEFFHGPQGSQRRLAVLPFTNLSSDPHDGLFADGLHEELLTALSQQSPQLQLISRTTMLTYRQNPKPISVIAAELGATHVLEASLRREPGQVRLNVQLIDARTDQQVWAENYDRTARASLGLQTEVARAVANQLVQQLAGSRPVTAPTQDTEAWGKYLQARALMGSTPALTPVAYAEVLSLLDGAIARDPRFTLAYLQRVRARMIAFDQGMDRGRKLVEATRADLDTARRLAPDEGQVHAAQAFYEVEVQKDFGRALQELDAARAAGNSETTWENLRTAALVNLGRTAEGLAACRQLVELDPASTLSLTLCSARANLARDAREAFRYLGLLQAHAPNDPLTKLIVAFAQADLTGRIDGIRALLADGQLAMVDQMQLGLGLGFLLVVGRYRDALEAPLPAGADLLPRLAQLSVRVQAALLLDDRTRAAAEGRALLAALRQQESLPWNEADQQQQIAVAYAGMGQCDRALQAAQRAVQVTPREKAGLYWVNAAQAYAGIAAWCGQEDAAVAQLETVATAVPGLPPGRILLDPVFAKRLGANPRYRALRSRLEQQTVQAARDLGLPGR